jgi:hypothetical protein
MISVSGVKIVLTQEDREGRETGDETMTASLLKLIEDAKAAGYTVEVKGEDIAITRRVGRWQHVRGLILFGDGTAFDVAVAPGVAKGLRSYKSMRQVLGIA